MKQYHTFQDTEDNLSAGILQPLDQYWTVRGMGNNAIQRVRVVVV